MIRISDPSTCCGCTACASICPKDAITMEPDALGFLYPRVDASRCVECGRCEQVCAFNDHYDTSLNLPAPLAYGARHRDMHEVETSRSGAAFIALSDHILAQGGVVYGAGYKDHFRVCHKRATTKEERDEFKGSKYVQSDLTGIFRQVKRDLKDGLLVLFSGTPCQTAGLNAYIGKRLRERLFLVDIVCHGVPGPYLWRDYLAYLERKQGSPIVWVNFRDKQRFGWRAHKETFKFLNGGVKSCRSLTLSTNTSCFATRAAFAITATHGARATSHLPTSGGGRIRTRRSMPMTRGSHSSLSTHRRARPCSRQYRTSSTAFLLP